MDATLILIDSDAELARARALVDQLWQSDEPADIARLQAQARLIAAYEEGKWPRRPPSTADLIRHLMDQHGLTRADMVPILGTPSRVSEVLKGKKGLSMAMVQRLRARFRVSADLLIPPPKKKTRSAARPNEPQPEFGSFGVVSPTGHGQFRVLLRRSGYALIAPRRNNSAHLRRPWRAAIRKSALRHPSNALLLPSTIERPEVAAKIWDVIAKRVEEPSRRTTPCQ
jgi:HTH-type transcriptional regulator/antitoxin HigA